MREARSEFLRQRNLVLRLAYDITASWTAAEDAAQHVFLWWSTVGEVRNPRACLARMTANHALAVVAARQWIGYVAPYLPEPIATEPVAEEADILADQEEIALMVVLDRLSPLEHAAFLLHDVFDFTHAEIASTLYSNSDAVRQPTSRARRHVHARGPQPNPIDPAELLEITTNFLAAARNGDIASLKRYLTDDVVLVGDGGGKRAASRHPIGRLQQSSSIRRGHRTRGRRGHSTRKRRSQSSSGASHRSTGELDQALWVGASGRAYRPGVAVRDPDKPARSAFPG